jgi:hypothetical protein
VDRMGSHIKQMTNSARDNPLAPPSPKQTTLFPSLLQWARADRRRRQQNMALRLARPRPHHRAEGPAASSPSRGRPHGAGGRGLYSTTHRG